MCSAIGAFISLSDGKGSLIYRPKVNIFMVRILGNAAEKSEFRILN
jgi:hypothetical protein